HGSEVTPPIMIGNNCRFRNHTIIGSNTIVGDNVIIDENTSVTDSIVYDNTYIGCDLDLDKKLVYKNHLISAISGEFIYITDRVLVSQVELGIVTSLFNRFVQRVFALGIVLLQVIPWLLLYLPYSIFVRERRSEFLISKSLATKYCEDPSLVAKTAWGRFMLRLCLDKFALLLQASLNRKVYLVGNRLLTNTVQHRKLVMELPVYNPGAFSLAETTEANSPDVEQFYELEYINNISTRFNIIIICRLISSRLMYGYR
ncbi:MAG: sugar transferase, partial [Candidatus Cloacimonetes bacterium]|nr:sugar transferase [Candidatus Cloacimonadota bacterium]